MRKCVGLLSALTLVSTTAGVVLADDVRTAEELPEAVRKTLVKESQGATIEDVEKETRGGKTVFEVELERNNEEWTLHIDEKGKVINREHEPESKFDLQQGTQPKGQTPSQGQTRPQTQSPSQGQTQPQSQPPSETPSPSPNR